MENCLARRVFLFYMPNSKYTNRPTHAVAPFNVTANDTGTSTLPALQNSHSFEFCDKHLTVTGLFDFIDFIQCFEPEIKPMQDAMAALSFLIAEQSIREEANPLAEYIDTYWTIWKAFGMLTISKPVFLEESK